MYVNTTHSITTLLLFLVTLFVYFPQLGHTQSIYISGSNTVISNGTFIYIKGNLINNNTAIINNQGTIKVTGNWTNNANNKLMNSDTGKVEMIGSSAQTINGTTGFHDLEVDNTAGVTIVSGQNEIHHTLYLTNGTLATNDSLVIISDTNKTARIDEIKATANITGDIIMQRYIDAGATEWRFLSTATSGATIADWNEDFITSGFIGSDFPDWPTAANRWPSIYYYDETQPGLLNDGFYAATNITNPIGVGEGLWVWSGDTITGTQPFTVDVQGPSNKFTINLPVTYTATGQPSTRGWNMVGNPYPSSVDWDSPNITKTNINNAIYIWNPDLSQFASYSGGISLNGGSRYITSSQAFWVQSNAANPSVQLVESCKSTTNASFLRKVVKSPLIITVQNNVGTDQLAINFDDDATNSFDGLYDAYKLASVDENLPAISSIMLDSMELSINQIPEQEISIPIKLLTGTSAVHNFTIDNVADFGSPSCLILEDLFTGLTYDLKTTNTFVSYIYDTTTVARFLLHIGGQIDSTITINGNSLTANATSLNYQWLDCNKGFSPIMGETFQTFKAINSGNYAVELTSNLCNKVDTSLCYTILTVDERENSTGEIALIIYPNPFNRVFTVEINIQETGQNVSLQIFNNLGKLVHQTTVQRTNDLYTKEIDLSNLSKGVYFLSISLDNEINTITKKILLQ